MIISMTMTEVLVVTMMTMTRCNYNIDNKNNYYYHCHHYYYYFYRCCCCCHY